MDDQTELKMSIEFFKQLAMVAGCIPDEDILKLKSLFELHFQETRPLRDLDVGDSEPLITFHFSEESD